MDALKYIIDKYNIKVGNQYIIDIPKVDREDLAQLFNELGVRVGAEIGVDKGEYSESLCKANPNCKIYGVDPYARIAYEPNIVPHDAGFFDTQEGFESNYDKAMARLSKFPNYVMMRGYSLDVLKQFEDNSLDFVYIDANHDMPNFINDIHQWSKKVRMGGIVSGHDYAIFSYKKFNHVKRALDAYARSYRMIPMFIIGRFEYVEGEKRDKFRSWMWVKDKHHG
jgi:hypothetical protein